VITLTTSKTLVALSAVTALLLAGCGGSDEAGDAASSSPATPGSTAVPEMSDQQAPPERLVVDVTIKGGEVTPTNEQLQAKVGDPIVVRVTSDAADQLHVHSNPEHTFDIEPKAGQSFQFTVAVPGKVDVELHELNRTIASIAVQ
jgi:major membrane immunogen (membrane-anchored lipoprotein)